ncbi:hypothetical protein BH09MYX1_BH09MYX1_50990 [soil metagenome]
MRRVFFGAGLACLCACAAARSASIAQEPTPNLIASASAPTPQTSGPLPEAEPPPRFQTRTIATDEPSLHYVGRPIDLDVKGADIHDVCRLLADVGKINIVVGDGVQGTVTLSMRHVPWDQVLDSVIQAKGLRMEREGNVILVFAK